MQDTINHVNNIIKECEELKKDNRLEYPDFHAISQIHKRTTEIRNKLSVLQDIGYKKDSQPI